MTPLSLVPTLIMTVEEFIQVVVCCARDLSMYPLCVDSHTNSAERCITEKILLINLKTF